MFVICVLLIFNTLPVSAVLNVLLVNIFVVSAPINVVLVLGNCIVPPALALAFNTVLPVDDPVKVAPPEPIVGVVKLGLDWNTNLPVPVAPVEVTPSRVTCPCTVN